MAEVKLHGFWYSPFTMRVVWALKIKGIAYENIEEDRYNKSPQLLQYNPVYKKTPVLVHDGKPLCESMLIVEYIDEIWSHDSLLPTNPYERAQARFWVKYADDMFPVLAAFFRSRTAEEKENNREKVWETLKVVEDLALGNQKKFFGGDSINIVDIAFGSFTKFLVTAEDVVEFKALVAEKLPLFHAWFNNFVNVPIIAENLPDHDKMVAFLKFFLEKSRASS